MKACKLREKKITELKKEKNAQSVKGPESRSS